MGGPPADGQPGKDGRRTEAAHTQILKWGKGQHVHQEDKWRIKGSLLDIRPLHFGTDVQAGGGLSKDAGGMDPGLGMLKHSLLEAEGRPE